MEQEVPWDVMRDITGVSLQEIHLLKIELRNAKGPEPPTADSPQPAGSPPPPVSPFKVPAPPPKSDKNNNKEKKKVTIHEMRLRAIEKNPELSCEELKQRIPLLSSLTFDDIMDLRDELPPNWRWSPLETVQQWVNIHRDSIPWPDPEKSRQTFDQIQAFIDKQWPRRRTNKVRCWHHRNFDMELFSRTSHLVAKYASK